jgi:hypothetical protein
MLWHEFTHAKHIIDLFEFYLVQLVKKGVADIINTH